MSYLAKVCKPAVVADASAESTSMTDFMQNYALKADKLAETLQVDLVRIAKDIAATIAISERAEASFEAELKLMVSWGKVSGTQGEDMTFDGLVRFPSSLVNGSMQDRMLKLTKKETSHAVLLFIRYGHRKNVHALLAIYHSNPPCLMHEPRNTIDGSYIDIAKSRNDVEVLSLLTRQFQIIGCTCAELSEVNVQPDSKPIGKPGKPSSFYRDWAISQIFQAAVREEDMKTVQDIANSRPRTYLYFEKEGFAVSADVFPRGQSIELSRCYKDRGILSSLKRHRIVDFRRLEKLASTVSIAAQYGLRGTFLKY